MTEPQTLRLYGKPSQLPPLAWEWVEDQLAAAGTYWVVAHSDGQPHPRPVWGIWRDWTLYLSIGSPTIVRALQTHPSVTIHLDSGTDVVIVEGRYAGPASGPAILSEYGGKYGRTYDPTEFGPLTVVAPHTVLAWRAAGWAGQDSFQEAGRWRLA